MSSKATSSEECNLFIFNKKHIKKFKGFKS